MMSFTCALGLFIYTALVVGGLFASALLLINAIVNWSVRRK